MIGSGGYQALFEYCPDGVFFTSPDGTILAANPAACEMLQLSEEEICRSGRQGLADPDDPRWSVLVSRRNRTGRASGVARMRRGDSSFIEVEMSARIFTEEDGSPRTCTVIRDVTARVAMEAELQQLTERLREFSMTDGLTAVLNRRGLVAFGVQLLGIADREGETVNVLFADVDDMKGLNDELGHNAGDAGLQAVARALTVSFRQTDVVARAGGDEFVVISLGASDTDMLARRIRGHISSALVARDVGRSVRVSLGWLTRPPGDPRSLEELMDEADQLMYRSRALKRNGRRRRAGPNAEGRLDSPIPYA